MKVELKLKEPRVAIVSHPNSYIYAIYEALWLQWIRCNQFNQPLRVPHILRASNVPFGANLNVLMIPCTNR